MAAPDVPIEVVEPVDLPATRPEHTEPLRPRTHRLAAAAGASARDRIVELSGALVDRTPPRTVTVDPEEAAELIVEQLRTWGYLE